MQYSSKTSKQQGFEFVITNYTSSVWVHLVCSQGTHFNNELLVDLFTFTEAEIMQDHVKLALSQQIPTFLSCKLKPQVEGLLPQDLQQN